MKRSFLILIVLKLASAPGPAAAQPAVPAKDAEVHYEKGVRLYTLAEYDAAIAEFKEAYKLDPLPDYLFNIAQSYRKKGDCVLSTQFYGTYLKVNPKAEDAAKVKRWVKEMEACVEARANEPPPVDTKPVETKPVDAKPVDTTVVDAKPVATTVVDATPVEAKPVDTDPVVAPAASPSASSPGKTLRIAGLATAGVGVVGMLAGTFFALRAHSYQSDVAGACASGCDWNDVRGIDAAGQRAATRGKISFAIGGVALVGGTVMYMLGRKAGRESPPFAIAPVAGGAVLVSTGQF